MAETDEDRTLRSLITEAVYKGIGKEKFDKSKKSQASAAEKLAIRFSDYYGGTDHDISWIKMFQEHLHSSNHSRENLSKTFAISERALSDDIIGSDFRHSIPSLTEQ